jgi:hypothetical protein
LQSASAALNQTCATIRSTGIEAGFQIIPIFAVEQGGEDLLQQNAVIFPYIILNLWFCIVFIRRSQAEIH